MTHDKSRTQSRPIAYLVSQFPETYETFIAREIEALEREGFDIRVFSLKHCRDEVVHRFTQARLVRTYYPGGLRSPRTLAAIVNFRIRHPIRCARALLQIVRKTFRRPGVLLKSLYAYLIGVPFAREMLAMNVAHIHAHWASVPATVAAGLSVLTDIPYSVTAHAYDIYAPNPALSRNLASARFVITCTGYNAKYLREKFPSSAEKVHEIYHGVDPEQYNPARHEAGECVEIISVGRLVETKGHEYLIRACAELCRRGLRFRLRLIGTGPLRRRLEKLTAALGMNDSVLLAGAIPHEELTSMFSRSDIFALASVIAKNGDRDGIPNAILEAMASSLPVVATRISGIPEAVINGQTGFLVPQRQVRPAADAIERLAEDPGLRRKLGESGRKLVEEKFHIEKNSRALAKLLAEKIYA